MRGSRSRFYLSLQSAMSNKYFLEMELHKISEVVAQEEVAKDEEVDSAERLLGCPNS